MPKKVIDPDLAEEIIDRNIRAATRIATEIFGNGRLDVAEEVVQPDYVDHANVPPDWPTGRPGLVAYVEMVRRAFPDLAVKILKQVGEGDRAFVHVAFTGTHLGEFLGVPASGRSVRWEEMHLCRMVDGRLAEHWESSDIMGLMQQINPQPSAN